MAQFLRLQITPSGSKIYQDHAHWEFTTIGGQLKDGTDATNELSSLLLTSAIEFPLDYPYLGVRIHAHTPDFFLREICLAIKKAREYPSCLTTRKSFPFLSPMGQNCMRRGTIADRAYRKCAS